MTQHIVAVSSSQLPYDWGPKGTGGVFPGTEGELLDTVEKAGLWVGPRKLLELDPSFRQIIPYVVLVDRVPSDPAARFLSYSRTGHGDEARLHDKASIGFGGHVDVADLAVDGGSVHLRFTLEAAAEREMTEEVGRHINPLHRQWLCALADNSTEVGRVHLGLVWLWMIKPDYKPTATEAAIANIKFMDRPELFARNLEPWSYMLLRSGVFE